MLRFLTVFSIACSPSREPVYVGDLTPAPTEPVVEVVAEADAPAFDTALAPAAEVTQIVQKRNYLQVSYRASEAVLLRVGSWSDVVSGIGTVLAPIRWTDLNVLDQDIWVRLEDLQGQQISSVLFDTKAKVRQPGDWRWRTDGDESLTVDCFNMERPLLLTYSGSFEIVWPHDVDPSWITVMTHSGVWEMREDRLAGSHPDGVWITIEIEAEGTVPICVVRWEDE